MKSLLLTLFITSLNCFLFAQNVGIGNTNPQEKLDVTGNINVTGTIKANGTSGQAGQVLRTNSSGNLEWSNLCNYQQFKTYSYTGGTQTFMAPAGVTRVLVEIWGGGGAGYLGSTSSTFGSGGGGGGYLKALIDVDPTQTFLIVVGGGGNSGTPNGQESRVEYLGFTYAATGGVGGGNSGGQAGTFYSTSPSKSFIGLTGQGGSVNVVECFQVSSTNFGKVWKLGSGGNGGNTVHTGGNGGSYTYDVTASTVINNVTGTNGWVPGGGGPASLSNPNVVVGGSGRVIIYY